jgi:hypothetical protein
VVLPTAIRHGGLPFRFSCLLPLPLFQFLVQGSRFWSLSLSKCKVQSLVKSNLEVDCLLPLLLPLFLG